MLICQENIYPCSTVLIFTWVKAAVLDCCCIEQSVIEAAKAAANASSSDIPFCREATAWRLPLAACLLPVGRLGTPGRPFSVPCSGRKGPVKKFVIRDWVDCAPAFLLAEAAALSAAAAADRCATVDFPSQLWSLGWRCVRQKLRLQESQIHLINSFFLHLCLLHLLVKTFSACFCWQA